MWIGKVKLASNLLLSPIAGYCDLAFRLAIRPLGGIGLASTDLINPKGVLRQTLRTMRLTETDPADQPLCIQLYGRDADEMADAAQWAVDHGAVIVDINMGCPVDKVCKRDGGSALLRNPAHAAALAMRVVKAIGAPVTVKMRLGWDDAGMVAPDLARALEDVGVAAITVHGRTAAQRFSGRVNHEGIGRVVEAVKAIPVIGNGDVQSPEDARGMMQRTGCAGVMIGRAALSNPWIFRDTQAHLKGEETPPSPTPAERVDFIFTHFSNLLRFRGEETAVKLFRQRISWYVRHLGRCKTFSERVRTMACAADFFGAVEQFKAGMESRPTEPAACSFS